MRRDPLLVIGLCIAIVVAIIFTSLGTYVPISQIPGFVPEASGATKSVSGLTEVTVPAYDDLLHVIDVSDTSFSASGTDKKVQIQYLPKGFTSASISGATLTSNSRTDQIPFSFVSPYRTGNSVFQVIPYESTLIGYNLVCYPKVPVNTGVTLTVYRKNKDVPTISSTYVILAGSGASIMSSGTTCFEVFAAGTTDFTTNDVLVAYLSSVSSGTTIETLHFGLVVQRD